LLLFIIDLIANEKKCECGEGFGDSWFIKIGIVESFVFKLN
jgi:hypothetical protein